MANERKFIQENIRRVLLKEYMMRETKRAGFGGVDIQRTPMGTSIALIVERPGFVIGRKGGAIKDLTEAVQYRFKFDNPQIEVKEVDDPSLNAQIMAEKLASSLERGWHFRRAGHSTVRRIMQAGAKGCQVIIAGKLRGERHRTEKYKEGHIKFCGEPRAQWMHEGYAVAKLKAGVIGVTVQIMDPKAKLPDEVSVMLPEDRKAEKAAADKKDREEAQKREDRRQEARKKREEKRGRDRKGGRRDRRDRKPRSGKPQHSAAPSDKTEKKERAPDNPQNETPAEAAKEPVKEPAKNAELKPENKPEEKTDAKPEAKPEEKSPEPSPEPAPAPEEKKEEPKAPAEEKKEAEE